MKWYEMLSQNSDLWSALLGAVVGAVVGGVISWLLQWDGQRRQVKAAQQDRLERQQALAYSIIYKTLAIASHYAIYQRHFDKAYAEAETDPDVSEPWQFVLAMGDEPDPINYTADEMTLLVSLGMKEVFNNLLTLGEAHNQMGRLSVLYRAKREGLSAKVPIAAFAEGAATSDLTREQVLQARPLMVELNSIAETMRSFAQRDAKVSSETFDKATAEFREKLKLPVTFSPR